MLHFYIFGATGRNLFKGQAHGHGDIVATYGATSLMASLRRASATEPAKSAESFKSTAESSENIVEEIVEASESLAPVLICSTVNTSESELIVFGFLVRIAEHGVCFRGFLELLLGCLFLGVCTVYPTVRMPFQGRFSIGALDIVSARTFVEAEHFIVISFFCHCVMLLLQPWRSAGSCR